MGADDLAAVIRNHAARTPAVVIAREHAMPNALLAALPNTPVCLYHRNWDVALARPEPFAGFDLFHESIPPNQVEPRIAQIHARGQRVMAFTINDAEVADRWRRAGADWIISDVPQQL